MVVGILKSIKENHPINKQFNIIKNVAITQETTCNQYCVPLKVVFCKYPAVAIKNYEKLPASAGFSPFLATS